MQRFALIMLCTIHSKPFIANSNLFLKNSGFIKETELRKKALTQTCADFAHV
jgi:hypothetical protein